MQGVPDLVDGEVGRPEELGRRGAGDGVGLEEVADLVAAGEEVCVADVGVVVGGGGGVGGGAGLELGHGVGGRVEVGEQAVGFLQEGLDGAGVEGVVDA